MTPNQLGILQDLDRKGYYMLEDCGQWLCDQLVLIILHEGPALININESYVVTLTDHGRKAARDEMGPARSIPGDAGIGVGPVASRQRSSRNLGVVWPPARA